MLGKLGPSVGWALFIGMMVISSNISGYVTGEWKTTDDVGDNFYNTAEYRNNGYSFDKIVCCSYKWGEVVQSE